MIVFLLCILLVGYHAQGQMCEPCEEQTQCKLSYTLAENGPIVSHLVWKFEENEMAYCYATHRMDCVPYPGVAKTMMFSIQSTNKAISTKVVISNATIASNQKTLEKNWELFAYYQDGSSQRLYTCHLKLYNRVTHANCSHYASTQGLLIHCVMSNVYPKSVCSFDFNVDKIHFPNTTDVTYRHTFSRDLFSYITECFVKIPIATLIPGRLYYNISISPDINMFNKVQKAGVNVKANISIEMPKLYLANCPDILRDTIQEVVIVNCICVRNDRSDIKTLMNWSTRSIDVKQFERFVVLQAIQKDTEYICTARNELGWTTFIKYRPSIKDSSRKQLGCPKEKPYNCSAECYSDNEFCLHGEVYGCVSANFTTQQEWCQSTVHSEGITSYRCKKMCRSHLPSSHELKNENNTVLLVLSVCGIVLSSVACVLLCLCSFRKRKKEVKLSEVTSNKHLKNDTKYNHNHVQKNLKDVAATCNKQPEETVSYVESSVKVNKSDKQCNFPKHMSQGGCSKGTVDIATTTHVVFDEAEAKCTTVELFDDEDNSGAKNKSLQGERFYETDRPGECVVQCETCDEDLCEKLASALTEQRERSKNSFVSHTHGKPKSVSFCRRSQVKDGSDATCPGYYGASVLMVHSESRSVHVEVHGKGNGFRPTGLPEKVPLLRTLKKVHL